MRCYLIDRDALVAPDCAAVGGARKLLIRLIDLDLLDLLSILKQLRDRIIKDWMHELRGNLGQRLQHKCAMGDAWVRNSQLTRFHLHRLIKQQIEVDRTWTVLHAR